MRSCGIIVEYNPFHNGHLYHAQMAKKITGAQVVIAVMSGNFLQRGEPAIIDKWFRAKHALTHGVDLVIELPTAFSIQPADYFAKGAIELLQAVGCETLCFGTEEETMDYEGFGRFVQQNEQLINQEFQMLKNDGKSYPVQMAEVFQKIYPEKSLSFSSPNHILGLSYAKENARYLHPMKLFPLKRVLADYHDLRIRPPFASASAIRNAVAQNEVKAIKETVPEQIVKDLKQLPTVMWEDFWPLLKYKLVSSSYSELQKIYQVNEGLEYRLKDCAYQVDSFQAFIDLAKTKRYTKTRLQRVSTYLLLHVTKEEVAFSWENNYLRILGMTKTGQHFLNQHKKNTKLPLITKINTTNKERQRLSIRSDQIYQLAKKGIPEQVIARFPIMVEKTTEIT